MGKCGCSESVTHIVYCRPPRWVGSGTGRDAPFLKQQVGAPARVGLPFGPGVVSDAVVPGLRVIGPDGNVAPSQSRILAHWPDGSVHGVLMDFAAGEEGLYEIRTASDKTQPQAQSPVSVEAPGDGTVRVTTGDLQAEVGGPEAFRSLRVGGKTFFDRSSLNVEVLDDEGKRYCVRNARNVQAAVEEAGPLRAVVGLSGTMAAEDRRTLLDFRLRFEFLHGVEGVSLSYKFTNRVPGTDFLKLRAICLRLNMGTDKSQWTDCCHYVYQQSFGLFTAVGRVAGCRGPLRVRVDDLKARAWVENFECPELHRLLAAGGLNREFGWAILALVYAWEITGLKRFEQYALKLMDQVMKIGLPEDVSSFDFGVTTILMGMQEYLEIRKGDSGVEHIKKWLLDFVDLGVHGVALPPKGSRRSNEDEWYGCHRDGVFNRYHLGLGMLAYAYEITGDEKYIRAGIRSVEALIDSPDWTYPPIDSPYWTTPARDGKPMAMLYRTFVNFLKPAAEKGYLKQLEYRF